MPNMTFRLQKWFWRWQINVKFEINKKPFLKKLYILIYNFISYTTQNTFFSVTITNTARVPDRDVITDYSSIKNIQDFEVNILRVLSTVTVINSWLILHQESATDMIVNIAIKHDRALKYTQFACVRRMLYDAVGWLSLRREQSRLWSVWRNRARRVKYVRS